MLPSGHLLYARWDYIDRDAVTHQNLWATRPDGTNPVAVWGNATPTPHCSFQAQPIPGTGKIVFTASAHHSITAGSICVVDPSVSVDGQAGDHPHHARDPLPRGRNAERQRVRRTQGVLRVALAAVGEVFPRGVQPDAAGVGAAGANDPAALGIYLLDVFGNRELIYRDPEIGSTNPCPLAARPTPPVVPSELPPEAPPAGEMILTDVYQGLGDVPRGTIKQLRIVQTLPQDDPLGEHAADRPRQRGERPGDPRHRAGRGRRLRPVPRAGR